MTNNNLFKIFSLKLARQLIDKGFECLGTAPNAQNPKFNVYLFEPTEDFKAAFKALQRGLPHGE